MKKKPINGWFLALAVHTTVYAVFTTLFVLLPLLLYRGPAEIGADGDEESFSTALSVISAINVILAIVAAWQLWCGTRRSPWFAAAFYFIAGVLGLFAGLTFAVFSPVFGGLLFMAVAAVIGFYLYQHRDDRRDFS